jgi:hypothetical protein
MLAATTSWALIYPFHFDISRILETSKRCDVLGACAHSERLSNPTGGNVSGTPHQRYIIIKIKRSGDRWNGRTTRRLKTSVGL